MADIGSVSREGDYAVIKLHVSQIHGLRVALRCPCGSVKSAETEATRRRLDSALAAVIARKK